MHNPIKNQINNNLNLHTLNTRISLALLNIVLQMIIFKMMISMIFSYKLNNKKKTTSEHC